MTGIISEILVFFSKTALRWFTDEQIRLTRDRKQGMLAQFQGSAGGAMLTAPGQRPSSVAHKQMAKQVWLSQDCSEFFEVRVGVSA